MPDEITPATLVSQLLDPVRRPTLLAALAEEQGSHLPLTWAYELAAQRALATPEELRRLVAVLEATDQEDRISPFTHHPAMPEDVLLDLCERGICVQALGHRGGPRSLLERMVELHRYPEAILSLALALYRDPTVSCAQFAAFVRANATLEWMLRSLAEIEPSDESKEHVYEELLADCPDAAAFHARRLACSEQVNLERLTDFLALHQEPQVLVLLLRSDLADLRKQELVERLAAARPDSTGIQGERDRQLARTLARSPDLTPEAASGLFAAADPEVLLELASNPRTPRPILEELAARSTSRLARAIRGRAKALLGRHRCDRNQSPC